MKCQEIKEMLPAYGDEQRATLELRRHLSRCSDCRAEVDRYEALAGGLRALVSTTAEPPARLLGALIAIPSQRTRIEEARAHVLRHRSRYLGGLAGAAAVAGTAALWRTRSRRLAAA
jgi:predicted anti-sigma-YlaC factor YlaD